MSGNEEGYYSDGITTSICDGGNRSIANPVLTTIPVTSLESTIAETRISKRYQTVSNDMKNGRNGECDENILHGFQTARSSSET